MTRNIGLIRVGLLGELIKYSNGKINWILLPPNNMEQGPGELSLNNDMSVDPRIDCCLTVHCKSCVNSPMTSSS